MAVFPVSIGALRAVCILIVILLLTQSASPGVAGTGQAPDPPLDDAPFVFEGVAFPSQAAFVASGRRCGADLDFAPVDLDVAKEAGDPAPPGSIAVPVYFHVVNRGPGLENGDVPDSMIEAQIAVLNDAYRTTPFRFELVEVDRTTNAEWYAMTFGTAASRACKAAMRRGESEALNLYAVSPEGGLMGWATMPSSYAASPWDDGVVILNTTMPGGSAAPYNLGHTATHEVGHWLGLYHTFSGGCTRLNDLVRDTPAEGEPSYGCAPRRNTCRRKGRDSIHNYMNYSDDACMSEFTSGQSARMHAAWRQYRASGG